MTEEEAKKELFKLNFEYMSNDPKKRVELYDDYIAKRNEIKKKLSDMLLKKELEKNNFKTR